MSMAMTTILAEPVAILNARARQAWVRCVVRLTYRVLDPGITVFLFPRPGGRFFWRWKDANSFKHRWLDTIERAVVYKLHFLDLRHTVATGCSKVEWIILSSKNFLAIGFTEPVTCTSTIGIRGYVMRSPGLLS